MKISKYVAILITILITTLVLLQTNVIHLGIDCPNETIEPIEEYESTYYEIDSTFIIVAEHLIHKVNKDRTDRNIKYTLYKDDKATDIFTYHDKMTTTNGTLDDLKMYLMYLYNESNPTPFKFSYE